MREVDENLRRDQLHDFFKSYGGWIVAGVILFLAVCGGILWWKQHQVQRSGEQVEKLAETYRNIASGNLAAAPATLEELSKSGSKAVRASALFARAAVALQQGDAKTATALYGQIASDGGMPKPYRDAALMRQTALEFDQLQPQQVVSRLEPLAKAGEPWFGSAGELTALAMIKQGRKQEAGQLYAAIAKDPNVPDTIRARALQVAGSLGIDAGAALETKAR